MSAAASLLPAFDPDSPDAEILAAYERIRANKAWVYSFDGMPDGELPQGEYDRRDALQIVDERIVDKGSATTIPGVIAQLLRSVTHADQSRWIDIGLVDHGFLALYEHRCEIDGQATQIAEAIKALLHIEWSSALADYERAAADFDAILRLNSAMDEEERRLRDLGSPLSSQLTRIKERGEELEDRLTDDPQLRRLVQTLTPDHDAFKRKVEIIIAAGLQENATPWLARDTNFLVGRIVRDAAPEKDAL